MINEKQYYIAPSQEVFDDIKQAAICVWNTYDNEFGYRTEKINKIKDLKNISDNYAYMIAMFVSFNQARCFSNVKLPETKRLIRQLLSDQLMED
jgi:hypothetical protein